MGRARQRAAGQRVELILSLPRWPWSAGVWLLLSDGTVGQVRPRHREQSVAKPRRCTVAGLVEMDGEFYMAAASDPDWFRTVSSKCYWSSSVR